MSKRTITIFGAILMIVGVASLPPTREHHNRRDSIDLDKLRPESPDVEGDPDAAVRYFASTRLPDGQTALDPQMYRAGIAAANQMEFVPGSSLPGGVGAAPGAALGTWGELGPNNVGGRTRSLLVHPTNPAIMYAGSVGGGIWKTLNSGASWFQLTDLGLPNLSISNLVFDPTNPNTIYAGTGEGYFNADAIRGAGIFKSTDAGATWTQLASTNNSDFYYVNRLVIAPNAGLRLYAATRTGVFRSLDGGGSWTKVLDGSLVNGCMDVRIQPNRALAYVFASCGRSQNLAALSQIGIFRALDNNNAPAFTRVFTATNMGRTSLAIAPSNPSVIYAMSASVSGSGNYNNGLLGVYKSVSNGNSGTWTTMVDTSLAPAQTTAAYQNTLLLSNPVYAYTACVGSGRQFINQGWYDNILAVDPTNANVVYSGGTDLFRSDDGGANWGIMSYWFYPSTDPHYAHADNHVFAFHPGFNGTTNQTLFVGSDGGLFRSDNARAATVSGFPDANTTPAACANATTSVTWNNLNNGYNVTQFQHGLPFPDGNTYFGGTQDNGTIGGTGLSWATLAGGDGGIVAVNPITPSTIFHEFTGLSIQRSTNTGSNWTTVVTGISGDTFPFYTFYRMDPTTPATMWMGGTKLWRTTNSATGWTQASTAITTGSITALAISPIDSNTVMAGVASGRIATVTNALSTISTTGWNLNFAFTNGGGRVSWLEYQPGSATTVFATSSTFGATNSATGLLAHVLKSTNNGANWTTIDGTGLNKIPDVPVWCIAISPTDINRMYVGTDLGVFTTVDGGANWYKENTGFANVPVYTLSFDNTGRLFAFTHGRGAWRVGQNP